jgi:hypothetical protein
MTNHRKSFKVSPQKRPLVQRLTPLAWVFIAIAALAILAGCTAGALTLTERPTDEPWNPTATATAVPTETPVADAGPSPTPTVWYEDIVTPTVAATDEVTAADSVWWSDQMTENEDGDLVPPQEVQDAVWEAFIAGLGCWNIPDRDTIPDASLDELVQQALPYLENTPEVLRIACNGFTSFEEMDEMRMEWMPAIRLVEFGPRNQVVCDTPTRCATAVSLEAQGAIWWHEETCVPRERETPCLLRLAEGEMVDQAPNQFYYVELEYNLGSERWRIVYLEVTDI